MVRIWCLSTGLLLMFIAVMWFAWPFQDLLRRAATSRPAAMPPPRAVYATAPTIEQVRQMAELVVLRIRVVDILTVEQAGWLSGYKGAWLIYGDALWTTDLEQARLEEVTSAVGETSIRIELPRPDVRWARLDHAQTRTYDLHSKAWLPLVRIPESVRDDALRHAQELVERAARRDDYRRQAERQTEQVLTQFFAERDLRVEIVWQDTAPATVTPASDP